MENPSCSDAVKFFLHFLETEPYISFNFKSTLYSHFQRLLSTPEKVLLLTDANFAAKVNRSRKYPPCDIDTTNFFDEEGDPIFVLEQQPCSPDAVPTAPSTSSKKTKGANTGLKRTLCAKTAAKKKRTRKTAPPTDTTTPPETVTLTAPPVPNETDIPASVGKPKPKPYRQPQLLTLPSTLAHPMDDSDHQFLSFSFLPTAGLTGVSLFQSFVTFCSASEQHAVLVSRAYVSQTYTKQGQMLAIRQVPFITDVFQIQLTVSLTICVAPFFSVHLVYKLGIFHKTGIPTQFVIQWLKSKYRTSEWGAYSEFLRLEGYTPGNYFFLGATLILTADNVLFFPST